MTRRDYSANARIPHSHHQDWRLIHKIDQEMDRVTSQWPNVGSRVDIAGINQLHGRYNSILDARVTLGSDVRDVTKVTMARFSKNDEGGSDWSLSISLCKHSSDTSWIYVSGPVQVSCESLARRMQEYILQIIDHPIQTGAAADSPGAIEDRLRYLHPAIRAGAIARLRNGHGDDALEEACKSIGARLRQMSGIADEDGASLVSQALGSKRLIALNDGASKTEVSEQDGYMHLGMALFRAARNPRAHRPADPHFDLDEVVEWLHVVSAMHRALDRAKLSS
ncbi:TIGR02391 family protein [Nocardia sp. NPDC051321]|uniref:TIGR02391 family protein n=1 Tax=Nocardia sp. NPDC051321 TaxID=3364323 RepID=UPI0037B29939